MSRLTQLKVMDNEKLFFDKHFFENFLTIQSSHIKESKKTFY